MAERWFLLLSVVSTIANVVGFVVLYRKVSNTEKRIVDLVNELGSMIGEWIDGQSNE